MLRQADYNLIAGVLADERSDALARGQIAAARQVEKTALALAGAFSFEYRFDPARFMLGVCDATAPDGLPAPIRHRLEESFGTSERRRRPVPDRGLLPRELVDTSGWTERTLIGAAIRAVSESHGASMATGQLVFRGIDTLGELAAKTDEELQAIPRIGPFAMQVIHEVLDLWTDRQHAAPSIPAPHAAAQAFPGPPRGVLDDISMVSERMDPRRRAQPMRRPGSR